MLVQQSHTTDFSALTRMFDAIEQGDMETVRRCYAPNALTWHNNDEIEQDVDAVIELLTYLCSASTSRAYQDRRLTTVGSQAFVQQTLTAELRSGRQLRMPAMMRVQLNADGLVERIEEYLDSRAVDALAEEAS
jgi:ketosteroid isomerase-like protein